MSVDVYGRECVRVTPRSASSIATGLLVIELPRSACTVSWPRVICCCSTAWAISASATLAASTIVRIEQGAFAAPRPDKLARIAEALGLALADVFALADYVVPDELPTFTPYLRAKYRTLPRKAVAELQRYFDDLADRYGIDPAGPAPGEDEAPEPRTRKR